MEFQLYISDFLRELTGYIRIIKQDADNPKLFWEDYQKPKNYESLIFYCNLDGGLKITSNLHQFLNKHLLLGNIDKRRVPSLAGQITRQTFGDMIFEPEIYEIRDVDGFANKALTTQDQLYIFLTNVANSGIRDWSKEILKIVQRGDRDAMQIQQQERRPGLLERIRGSADA